MESRIGSGLKAVPPVNAAQVRRRRYKGACLASLRWVRNACGLLVSATALGWLVVKFTR
jgi:hypothetical protein